MEIIIWPAIFIISLYALLKASEWFTQGIEKIFGRFGVSVAEISVITVAIGTSLPELAAAVAAILQGKSELAVPLAVGSSIANILLVVGIGALSVKTLLVKKEHLDLDIPLFVAAVAIFYFIAADGKINFNEGMFMSVVFFSFILYILSASFGNRKRNITPSDIITPDLISSVEGEDIVRVVPTRTERNLEKLGTDKAPFWQILLLTVGGSILLVLSANFTIESLVNIANLKSISIPVETMAIVLLAVGVTLPELMAIVSVSRKNRYEMVMGDLFNAITINLLLVCGVAALFTPLQIDDSTLAVGLPFLVASAGLVAISSFSRRINFGEGIMFLFLYFLFFVKVLGLF